MPSLAYRVYPAQCIASPPLSSNLIGQKFLQSFPCFRFNEQAVNKLCMCWPQKRLTHAHKKPGFLLQEAPRLHFDIHIGGR